MSDEEGGHLGALAARSVGPGGTSESRSAWWDLKIKKPDEQYWAVKPG